MKRGSYSDDRAQPDISDPVDPASRERVVGAVAGDLHRVHAEGRAQIVAKTEIDGRKADRAAAPIAFQTRPSISQYRPSCTAASRGLPARSISRIWVEE